MSNKPLQYSSSHIVNFLILNCNRKNFTNDDSAKVQALQKNYQQKWNLLNLIVYFQLLL